MHLSEQRYNELKIEAVNLLIHCHTTTFPLDPHSIILKLNGHLLSYSSLSPKKLESALKISEDGFSFFYHNDWYVWYNNEKCDARIKMTLLHEIAHKWLNHSNESDLAEAEAKFFAKYILAPPAIIHQLKLKSSLQLMFYFGNSYEAASYAWNYYLKWRQYSGIYYSDQEIKLINLVQDYIKKNTPMEAI